MRRTFLVIILFVIAKFGISQQFATGLKWDDEAYDKVEKVSSFGGGFGFSEASAVKYSLKKYTPTPNNQKSAGSCVAQSVGYGALTTLKAIKYNWTDKHHIDKEALSAMYIYNQINEGDCGGGSRYTDAFKLLKTKGDVKKQEFEKDDNDNCSLTPTSINNPKLKIESYTKLFDRNADENIKVNSTRAALLGNNPVLIAFELTSEFTTPTIKKNKNFYKPTPYAEKVGGHAMFVVGYDDAKNAFEVQNSWGNNWGNKGYFYISYKDYAEQCKYAYIVKLKEEVEPNQPKVDLAGSFVFKSVEYKDGSVQKITQNITCKGKYYELTKNNWRIGSQFQLIANNISTDDYVYVFSIDSKKVPFVHFPKNARLNSEYLGFGEAPIVPFKNAEIYIPSENTALTKDHNGTDYLFVLFSELKLDEAELKNNIDELAQSQGNIIDNFYSIFSNKLIPTSILNYSTNSMQVKVNTDKGFIAPIILTVK